MDSNHRRLAPTDLQSVAFGRSANLPQGFLRWSGRRDSNSRPHGPKPRAIPTSPRPGNPTNSLYYHKVFFYVNDLLGIWAAAHTVSRFMFHVSRLTRRVRLRLRRQALRQYRPKSPSPIISHLCLPWRYGAFFAAGVRKALILLYLVPSK